MSEPQRPQPNISILEGVAKSGRPLLVVTMGDGYQALTGSHRWAAAQKLRLDIPSLVIDAEELAEGERDAELEPLVNRQEKL